MLSLPEPSRASFAARIGLAVAIILLVAMMVWLDRSGYRDANGDGVSLGDAIYYSTVSVTTTGYGDITPETDRARFITTVFVTPARVIFLVLLLGTTLELLFGKMRARWQKRKWQQRTANHWIVVGYGVKGRAAVARLLDHDASPREILVIDQSKEEVARANKAGLAAIEGSGSSREVLREAGLTKARALLLALDSDDHTLLATLRAREISDSVRIIASCRDDENAEALRRAGASQVIVSAGAAGRLVALAGETPRTAEILEDILDPQDGFDIVEKDGPAGEDEILLAVIQGDRLLRWPEFGPRKSGDRVIVLCRGKG